ncbi:coiled-coil domain-containing protein 28B-like isoform X1 [Hydra vulgaris]|uniref:Coiled-coil domain-containing protein 28B-like isoform X1 n=1 Tax=Hydra vulgaris TaxID=6087 RepID=A0ABM4BGN2_HYDVU
MERLSMKKSKSVNSSFQYNAQEHTFLSNQAHMVENEDRLLKLLTDFKSGKLNAFDENCNLEKMNNIKVLQEKLAHLHFQLEDEDANKMALSEEERSKRNQEMMDKLMSNMETLCSSIQSLHTTHS